MGTTALGIVICSSAVPKNALFPMWVISECVLTVVSRGALAKASAGICKTVLGISTISICALILAIPLMSGLYLQRILNASGIPLKALDPIFVTPAVYLSLLAVLH